MSNRKSNGGISGKGYYIALVLSAAAIGIIGYLYYANTQTTDLQGQPAASVSATQDMQVEAAATTGASAGTEDTVPATQLPSRPAKRVKPVDGQVVSEHAMDALSYNQTTRDWRVHDGVDITAAADTPVCAAADGTVYTVYEDETMGKTVVIRHEGGYTTRYSSLAETVSVNPGDTVEAGDQLGYVGNTALLESAIGDHVHFSVSCGTQTVDPMEFLDMD